MLKLKAKITGEGLTKPLGILKGVKMELGSVQCESINMGGTSWRRGRCALDMRGMEWEIFDLRRAAMRRNSGI